MRQAVGGSVPLTGPDSFWLRMDHPTNLMMINGVLLFDEPLDFDRVREVLGQRVAPLARFRDRIVQGPRGAPRWEPDPAFDLDRHVTRERLAAGAGEAGLRELVSRKMSEPLDRARPLWQFNVVESVGAGSALIGRFHHCLGDGFGMMMVMLAMTDGRADEPAATRDNPFIDLLLRAESGFEAAWRRVEELMPEGAKLLSKPVEALAAADLWRRTAGSAWALARLTFRSSDSKTALNAPRLGIEKRAAWSEPIALDDVRAVRDRLGGTVNDILLSCTAGGIRRYLLGRGGEAACKDFRATVPVNLRPMDQIAEMGNEFGLVYLSLPIGVGDPLARLAELRRRMEALKRSAEAPVTLWVMSLMGRMPAAAQRALVRLFASKATAVMTNVPGPNRTLYLAGRAVRDVLFWVPRSARLSLGVSIMSYAGRVRMGVATDAGLVPDPERIVEGFHGEFEAVRELARSR